jgi:membrane protein implicated in regulation of membrane protease activity
MKRLWVALGAFGVLMVLTWTTIDDQKFRLAALAILAMFAVRTWSRHRKLQHEAERQAREDE